MLFCSDKNPVKFGADFTFSESADNAETMATKDLKASTRVPPPAQISPLEQYRGGSLWVSDLSSQSWCEQQMVYNFTVPGVVVENPVMTAGTNMHLARGISCSRISDIRCFCGYVLSHEHDEVVLMKPVVPATTTGSYHGYSKAKPVLIDHWDGDETSLVSLCRT